MKYPATVLDQIKQRASLVEEVRQVVPDLKRKGKFWWGCCPFHKEKSPSFHVREDEGHYHCFGCGAHGDVVTFVMETRGGTFTDTIEHLAAKTGVDLPKVQHDPAAEKARDDGLKALARAQTYYQRNLEDVQGYIQRRGLKPETIQTFGLGFAPESWDATRTALTNENFSIDILRTAGLSIQSDKGRGDYDRFRGRLMFPIHDLKDRVIAFGGRIVGEGEPKYLNSPDTPFFNKSYTLYNLNRARSFMRQEEQALLVEGYMDVIALWQAGIKTAVAPMGTAVTPDQINVLWQYQSAPIVCLDGDSAGRSAAIRLAKRVLPQLIPGKTLRFMYLPDGEDPDSFVQQKGRAAFLQLTQETQSLEDVLWHSLSDGIDLTSGEGRAQVEEGLKSLTQDIAHEVMRRHVFTALKDRLWQARSGGKKARPVSTQGRVNWVPQSTKNQGVRQLLALACYMPQFVATYEEDFLELQLETQEDKTIYNLLVQAFLNKKLAKAEFNTYVAQCGQQEEVQQLLKQALLDQWIKDQPAHAVEVLFADCLRQVRQEQQTAAQRQQMMAGLNEEMSPEVWQKLKALGAKRAPKD